MGASLGDLVPLGAALVDGCALDVGAGDPDGEVDGERVEVGPSLGDLVLLGAALADGCALDVGSGDLDGGADKELVVVG